MNCTEARGHWNLYHDSEGDAELHFQINEHLAMCPACAEWFSRQSRLEGLIADQLRPPPPTAALWDQMLVQAGLVQPVPRRRWVLFSGLAACAALVAFVTWLTIRPGEADLSRLTAQWHERLLTGTEKVQFRPQGEKGLTPELEVEGYLRKHVSFKMRCPPRKDVGFEVQGGGVGALADRQAAYLIGHVDKQPVSIFILAGNDLPAVQREGTHRFREGDYQMVLGVVNHNAVVVIGTLDAGRLERVLNAHGTYPEPEG